MEIILLKVLCVGAALLLGLCEGSDDAFLQRPQHSLTPLNQTATFNCSVVQGQIQWAILLGGTVPLMWPLHRDYLIVIGIYASGSSLASTLHVHGTVKNNGTSVQCLCANSVQITRTSRANLMIFDHPPSPCGMKVSVSSDKRVLISWLPSSSLPGVPTWYTVNAVGLTEPYSAVTSGVLVNTSYEYNPSDRAKSCQQYLFTVVAENGAGQSYPSEPVTITIPNEAEEVFNLTAINTMLKLNVRFRSDVEFTIKFHDRSCYYCTTQYYVNLFDISHNVFFILGPYSSANGSKDTEITIRSSDGLQQNTKYNYTISEDCTFSETTNGDQVIYTTDVQFATLTVEDVVIKVSCVMAEGSLGKGCVLFNANKQIRIPWEKGNNKSAAELVIVKEDFLTLSNVLVKDWELDGTTGSLPVPLIVTQDVKTTSLTSSPSIMFPAHDDASHAGTAMSAMGLISCTIAAVLLVTI